MTKVIEDGKSKTSIMNKQAFFEKEKAWPRGTKIEELEDGSVELTLTVRDYNAWKSRMLSMGENAYVEKPKIFADWIKRNLKNALAFHSKPLALNEGLRMILAS